MITSTEAVDIATLVTQLGARLVAFRKQESEGGKKITRQEARELKKAALSLALRIAVDLLD